MLEKLDAARRKVEDRVAPLFADHDVQFVRHGKIDGFVDQVKREAR